RRLAPAPDRAAEALAGVGPEDGPLLEVLARRLARLAGEPVRPEDFDLSRVPPHLLVRFRVEDEEGREVAAGRDLAQLQRRLRGRVRRAVAAAAPDLERQGLRSWEVGDLPRTVEVEAGGRRVRGYPALIDEGETVGVRVLTSPEDQERAMWTGTRRLLLLAAPAARRDAERRLRAQPALVAARPCPPWPSWPTAAPARPPTGSSPRTADRCGRSGPSPSWPPAPGPGWSRWRWARPAGPASWWRRPPASTAGSTRSGPRCWRRRSRTCGSSCTASCGPGSCGP